MNVIVNGNRIFYDTQTGRVSVVNAVDDTVNHPSHYTQGKIECIDYIIDKKLSYCLGNAIKYITRCELKNGGKNRIEDLRKAVFYINKQIEVWEAEDERQ
jgi:hypothetical protein